MSDDDASVEFVEFGWQLDKNSDDFAKQVADTKKRLIERDWHAIAKERGYVNEGFASMIKNLYYDRKWDKESCLHFVHKVGARPYKYYNVFGDRPRWVIGEENNVGVLFNV